MRVAFFLATLFAASVSAIASATSIVSRRQMSGAGIKFDATRRTFFVSGRSGHAIAVARFRGDPFCSWVDLAPGAKIYLLKQSGRVTAILTATDHPRGGGQWIETDDNWSLQNLLAALFSRPAPGLP